MRAVFKGALAAIGLIAGIGTLGTAAQADSQASLLNKIVERGVLKVGTTGDYPPFSERDQASNGYRGFDIDIASRIAADLGVKVEFVQTTWETLAAGLEAGKYDIAASGITITLDRLKSVAFADPMVEDPILPIINKKDAGKFKTWRDLDRSGVKIAVQIGSSVEETAKRVFTKATLVRVAAPALDYQELLAGHADAAITDLIFVKKALAQYPQIVTVDEARPIEGQPNSIMTTQGDQIWLNWLNTWVRFNEQSGYLDSLRQKWIFAAQ